MDWAYEGFSLSPTLNSALEEEYRVKISETWRRTSWEVVMISDTLCQHQIGLKAIG